MTIAFRKIWRDLWNHKWRTLLVVLSISVGVMAVGMIVSSRELALKQLTKSLADTRPAHVRLSLGLGVVANEETVAAISNVPGVAQVDGMATMPIRWKPTLDSEWRRATVSSVDDYLAQKFSHILLRQGSFPTSEGIAVEEGYISRFNIPPVGSTIYIEVNDRSKPLKLGGAVYDFQEFIALSPSPSFYATRVMLRELGGTGNYTSLRFTISNYTRQRAEAITRTVESKLSKAKVQVIGSEIRDPDRHPGQDGLNAFVLILGVMGVVSLGMSAFLVINTIHALIAQQVFQIGIMKTIGGLTSQIVIMYLVGVAVYGVLSLVLALPLGALGGVLMTNVMLLWFNIPAASLEIVIPAFAYQVGVGLITPLLAALFPVWNGTRVTVRQAIAQYGLGTGHYGASWLDQLIGRVRGLPRLITLALRNTFRRPWRVALTQITLITAGASFMMVASTQTSFDHTINNVLQMWGFDVQMILDQAYRVAKIEQLTQAHPETSQVEMWTSYSAKVRLPNDKDITRQYNITLFGIPSDTRMFTPQVTMGRGLDPSDVRGILLNQKIARDLNVKVGDEIEVDYGAAGTARWTIIGLLADIVAAQQTGYVPREQLGADAGDFGRASVLMMRIKTKSVAAQENYGDEIRAFFKSQGVGVADVFTVMKFQSDASGMFAPIAGVLMTMSILIAIVGSLSLSSTLSINVIERRREIGVMRAVGASSNDIAFVFMCEGLMLGLLSWVVALPLSMIGAPAFLNAIGDAFSFPMWYEYAPLGAVAWLIVVIVLSLLASWLPARQATRISVQQSLAYE